MGRSPNWSFDFIPTPAQWNDLWASKQDDLDLSTATIVALGAGAGNPNGVATLDSTGAIPSSQLPSSIAGALSYQGSWNASTNSPTLVSGTGTKGQYFVVSVAGTTLIDGISNWNVGDQIAFNGTAWQKISGNSVVSVAGLTGTIAAPSLKAALAIAAGDVSGLAASATTNTTNAANISSGTLAAGRLPALTGDVTSTAGAVATTIAANAVSNAKLAQMAAGTVKANNTSSTANASDVSIGALLVAATGLIVPRSLANRAADFLNVLDFGAIGDGNSHPLSSKFATLAAAQAVYPFATALTDELDWCGLQAMAFYLATHGGWGIVPGKGPYLIDQEVDFINQSNTATVLTGSQFPFSQTQPFRLSAPASAEIRATATMDAIFDLSFNNTTISANAPWYATIEGFYINGNKLASAGITSDFAFGIIITNNRINNVTQGVFGDGFGGAHIYDNEICAQFCIFADTQFGDSVIECNDLYPLAGGAAIRMSFFGGDTKICNNTVTGTGTASDTIQGVQIDGNATQANSTGNIAIYANEFDGVTNGVAIFGNATPNPTNVANIIICNNHTAAFGAVNPGSMVFAQNAQGLNIYSNNGGNFGIDGAQCTNYFAQLVNCFNCKISNNQIVNYKTSVVQLFGCTDVHIDGNDLVDVGQDSAGDNAINLSSASNNNTIWSNRFLQRNAAFAQVGVQENTGCNFNDARSNQFQGVLTPYVKSGANTSFQFEDTGSAIPTTGTFLQGSRRINSAPAASGNIGWVCTAAGTPGTWKTFGAISA